MDDGYIHLSPACLLQYIPLSETFRSISLFQLVIYVSVCLYNKFVIWQSSKSMWISRKIRTNLLPLSIWFCKESWQRGHHIFKVVLHNSVKYLYLAWGFGSHKIRISIVQVTWWKNNLKSYLGKIWYLVKFVCQYLNVNLQKGNFSCILQCSNMPFW